MEDCNQEWLKSNATATNGLVFCGLVQSSPQSFFGPMDQTLKLYCVHLSAGEVWFGLVWAIFSQTGNQTVQFLAKFSKPKPKLIQTI